MVPATTPTAREMFTEEQIATFLDLVRQGIGRHLAAQRIQSTGRQMRALARPERDPQFAAEYEAAYEEGQVFYRERLKAEARTRALDGSDRLLEVELATHVEDYAHLRRDRVRVNGTIQHEHAVTINLDPNVLDSWEPEKLASFKAYLVELQGEEAQDAEYHELPAP